MLNFFSIAFVELLRWKHIANVSNMKILFIFILKETNSYEMLLQH